MRAEDIRRLEAGKLPAAGFASEMFQVQVAETVDTMLRRYVRKFNRSLREAMELGDLENVQILCRRLQREMEYCFFFRNISFLPKMFTEEMERAVREQISIFWKKEIQEFARLGEESGRPELEDVIYFMRRIRQQSGV